MFYNVRDFGALGDGVTDDLPAFEAALRSMALSPLMPVGGGAILLVPAGNYFLNGTLRIGHEVQVIGITGRDGKGAYLPFSVTSDGRASASSLPGAVSRLMFPAGVTGLHVAVGGAFAPGIGSREHAAGTVLRNLVLVAAQLDDVAYGHGIAVKGHVIVDNCFIYGFSGNGIHIVAPSAPPPEDDGTKLIDAKFPQLGDLYRDNRYEGEGGNYPANTIDSHFTNIICRKNGLNGVYVAGSNCGNMTFEKVHCLENGAYGFFDAERSAANIYIGCHSQINGKGGYYCFSTLVIENVDGTRTAAPKTDTGSIFISCYQEQADNAPTRIYGPAHILGGVLGAEGANHTTPDPDLAAFAEIAFPPPSIQRQEGRGWAATGFPNGVRAYGGPSTAEPPDRVAIELGSGIPKVAMSLHANGVLEDDTLRLRLDEIPGWWTFSGPVGIPNAPLRIATRAAVWPGSAVADSNGLWLSNGLYLGWLNSSGARPIYIGAAEAPTSDEKWQVGDILWNLSPTPGAMGVQAYKSYAGWMCTSKADFGTPARATEWAGFGKLEAITT
jgi:hypothetical protein